MFRKLLAFTILLVFAAANVALALNDEHTPDAKRSSVVALPYAFYSPETKFAFGAGGLYSFRLGQDPPQSRPSNVKIGITVTQRKQLILAAVPELYFKNESYYLIAWFTYYHYPDKFWGIGNDLPEEAEEKYSMNYVKTFLNFQRRAASGLYVGARYQFEHIELTETAEGGALRSGIIPGSEPGGGLASGLGFVVNYDTRDNIYYPKDGRFYQVYGVFFDDVFGSDYRFNSFTVDLREYRSLLYDHVLAFQALTMFIGGTPPMQMMALLGGSNWMRGYHFGRYRDKNMVVLQTEYRFPVAWRFGGAAFAGLGDVARDVGDFRLKEFKYSLGVGLRLMIDTREKINVRLDLGFGRYGDAGVYAMVVEAF